MFSNQGSIIDVRIFYRSKDATNRCYVTDNDGNAIIRPGKGLSFTLTQPRSLVGALTRLLEKKWNQ